MKLGGIGLGDEKWLGRMINWVGWLQDGSEMEVS